MPEYFDSFFDANGVDLRDHTPESEPPFEWSRNPSVGSSGSALQVVGNALRKTDTGTALYLTSVDAQPMESLGPAYGDWQENAAFELNVLGAAETTSKVGLVMRAQAASVGGYVIYAERAAAQTGVTIKRAVLIDGELVEPTVLISNWTPVVVAYPFKVQIRVHISFYSDPIQYRLMLFVVDADGGAIGGYDEGLIFVGENVEIVYPTPGRVGLYVEADEEDQIEITRFGTPDLVAEVEPPPMAEPPPEDSIPYHLDRLVVADAGEYDGVNTIWKLPYSLATDGSEGTVEAVTADGAVLVCARPTAYRVSATGDHSSATVYLGIRYQFRYVLSRIFRRARDSGRPETRGRLQLHYLNVFYRDTQQFRVEVTPTGSATYTYPFPQAAEEVSGNLPVPVMCENEEANIEILSDYPFPVAITSLDWEGIFHARAQRF